MKVLRPFCIIMLGSLLFTSTAFCSTDKYWKAVDSAMQQGLPRTAVKYLDSILVVTQKEKIYGEWLRALTEKVVIEATIHGNKPEEKVRRLKAEFAGADAATRPLLEAVLAEWYWQYYQRNSWRFMNRTATEEMSDTDFTTWDLPKIFNQIDSLYQDILTHKDELTKIPAREFYGFLERGSMPTVLRPTLYDFIAHQALGFYENAAQAALRPEDAFEIDANSDAFAPAGQFLKYKPVASDTTSPRYKALVLYQSLMAFHLRQKDTANFVDLDIERLNYIKNVSFGEDRNEIFIERMRNIVEKYRMLPISSLAAYYLVKAWVEEDSLSKAYTLAKEGYERYPNSVGGELCDGYTIQLMQKSLKLTAENYLPPDKSQIQISYKNFTKVYFRIYADNWRDRLTRGSYYYAWREPDSVTNAFLSEHPIVEWSADLSATEDLREKTMMLDVPKLNPGYYRIFASWQPDFSNSTMVQYASFWVCSFTVVYQTGAGFVDGLVLNAMTGEPIEGATVSKVLPQSNNRHIFGQDTTTDENGYFRFNYENNENYLLYIKKGNEELLTNSEVYTWQQYHEQIQDRVVFFADRSLYRPGQTIFFEGICVHIDQDHAKYDVVPDRRITVYFRDVNGKKIADETFTTNDFGSFSGQFTAPTDRLTGWMRIEAGGNLGFASFRVEEYKRPTFSVELEKPKQAVKLNEEVEITGKAMAYNGAPVDNAEVKFSVQREAFYPNWFYWYRSDSYRQSGSAEIAFGKVKTDHDGNFKIAFFSRPDPKMSPDDNPTFTYAVHADVVSPDGETHSADTYVHMGYSALAIKMTSGDDLEDNAKFPLIVSTETLDGTGIPANAEVRIYRLMEPATPIRAKLNAPWGTAPLANGQGEFSDNWMTWPNADTVYEASITTKSSNPDTIFVRLQTGLYKVECAAKDKYGKEVESFLPLMVMPDWQAKRFNIKLPFVAEVKSSTVEVGNDLQLFWGTGYDTGRCFIEIERGGIILKKCWTAKDRTQQSFTFPVTEDLRGGFEVCLTEVRENRAYIHTIPIRVPWDNKHLDVSIQTFRDKMAPGEKETITLKIKGEKKPVDAAEVLATMYDYSLDQIYPHQWQLFNFFKRDYSGRNTNFINRAQPFRVWRSSWNPEFSVPAVSYVHFPDYVLLSLFNYAFPSFSSYNEADTSETASQGTVMYGEGKQFEGEYGRFHGRIVDAVTHAPLPGATVMLKGTSIGASTDLEGHFTLLKVPEGQYTLVVSYIGYVTAELPDVKSKAGRMTLISFRLTPQTFVGKEVVVTGQARGEMASVSQQVSSNIATQTQLSKIVAYSELGPPPGTVGEASIVKPAGMSLEPINFSDVTIRKNLNETAFFYPHLLMDKNGMVRIEFTMPEALTQWKFMAFAHGKECQNGMVTAYAVTQKDLMVQPNAPRFLRQGDTLYFTVNVINMSDQPEQGRVQLDFKDLATDEPMDSALQLVHNVQAFDIKAHSSETHSWRIVVPNETGTLTYTVVAKSRNLSDGETGALPVLSNRVFLTESIPLDIRGPETKDFTFERLKEIGKSKTFEPFSFTVQMASNPTWYAIQALPYLMESRYECSEQTFDRLYANSLAAHIVNSNPRIKQVFDDWRRTGSMKSNLAKNQGLKSVMLMETPWVLEAENETQAMQNIASLFDENTLRSNINSAFFKLESSQLPDGSWSWFPGGRPDAYITLYITTGFGRLMRLGVQIDNSLAIKALGFLDRWIESEYKGIRDTTSNNLSPTVAMYLYCRSFYIDRQPIPQYAETAVNYFIRQTEAHWLSMNSLLCQGYIALALHRFGFTKTPKQIMASIKERSVESKEMGMYWPEDEQSWWWYRAPIETQALMIEAFSEVTKDTAAVEACKIWLLKQKQTQDWGTTKATADAVYALVLNGTNFLSQTRPVEVEVGKTVIKPKNVEAGTGFYEKTFYKNEIEPDFSNINVTKKDAGIAWGGAYLQYFEDLSHVTPHKTNLQLEKELFVKKDTKRGEVIEPIKGPLHVGDLITVRIILRVDRDMEYVHLKDMRGSGLEPVSVLSGYRYQDGLRYYQSTRDASTDFFIDYLPKGTYVFEYDLRVQLRGEYQDGIANIECMYAPEFSSHSGSERLEVR